MVDAQNTTIKITLPEEILLVKGDLEWRGNIKKGERIENQILIKPVQEGEWKIKRRAATPP